jgi:hypothetical protein
MLSKAKHLCVPAARPFAEFTLSEANGLRVTPYDRAWVVHFIISLRSLLYSGIDGLQFLSL